MKRYFVFTLSLLALSSFVFNAAFAQQATSSEEVKAEVVANVSVRNLAITGTTDKDIKISLDLVNNGEALSGIAYGFELMSGNVVADIKSLGEPISLASKERRTIEATYTYPAIPAGIYAISFKANALSGMPYASARVSNIEIPKKSIFGILPQSCVLRVSGEPTSKTYSTNEGVDILPTEKLIASCEVVNTLSYAVNLTPFTETFLRNRFGQKVSQKVLIEDMTSVAAGAKKVVSASFDIPQRAQSYDTVLSFTDDSGAESNAVSFHYVVRGKSATIQSISLDKTSYSEGEAANVSIRWTASADSFPDSRLGSGTLLSSPNAIAKITSSGTLCAPEDSRALSAGEASVSIVMQSDCPEPKLEVSVRDGAQVLARAEYYIEPPASSGAGMMGVNLDSETIKLIVIVVGALIIVALAVFLIKRKKVPTAMIFLMATAFALGANSVDAATITWTDNAGHSHQATVDMTKDSYDQMEPVILDANFDSWYQWCTNGAKRDVYFGYVVKDSNGNVVSQGDPSKLSGQVVVYDPASRGPLSGGSYTVKAVFGSNIMEPDQWTTTTCEVTDVDQSCMQRVSQEYSYNNYYNEEPNFDECLTVSIGTCQVPTHYALTDRGSYGSIDLNFNINAPIDTNHIPDGVIDSASCDNINGWTVDGDVPNQSLYIHIYKNGPAGVGTIVGAYPADQYRPDVNQAFGIGGNHGYSVPVPENMKTGQSTQIYVYAIGKNDAGNDDSGNSLLSGSPKTINCQPTPPVVNPPQVCQDGNANNYGGSLPCTYNPPVGPTCQDPSANNYGGGLPCTYSLCQDLSAQNYGGSLPCTYPPATLGITLRSSASSVTLSSPSDTAQVTLYSQANVPEGTSLTQHGLEYRLNGGSWQNAGAWNDLIPNTERQTDAGFSSTVISSAGTHDFRAYGSNNGGATYFYTSPVSVAATENESCLNPESTSCASFCSLNPNNFVCTNGGGNGGDNNNNGGNGGDGGNGGNNNGGGDNNPLGFTITSSESSTAPIQFLGTLSSTSTPRRLEVNPVGVFASPVTLQVTSIQSRASGASLPEGVVASYSFDGAGPTASLGFNGTLGRYISQRTGLIGTTFEVALSKPITEPYNVTIEGVSGNVISTYVITLDPNATIPSFREI